MEKLVKKYEDDPEVMFAKMTKKYGVDPRIEIPVHILLHIDYRCPRWSFLHSRNSHNPQSRKRRRTQTVRTIRIRTRTRRVTT